MSGGVCVWGGGAIDTCIIDIYLAALMYIMRSSSFSEDGFQV